MKLAISNIAWKPEEAEDAYALLEEMGVGGLEIAPGLFFAGESDPFRPSEAAVADRLERIRRAGLELVSMQSLLFGVEDAALFGSGEQCERFVAGLVRAIDLAARLEIPNLVVGSPANRVIPTHMEDGEALSVAMSVFRLLADHAKANGCRLAMEPNPAVYGTNFLTSLSEAVAFVREVDHPAVMLNFDTGALHLNGEIDNAGALFAQARPHISHVHVSEAHLAPVPGDQSMLLKTLAAVRNAGWQGWVSIEMRAAPTDRLAHARQALRSCLDAIGA
ncbi:sugar phosphate isomerase/epimerase family protein [Aquamicrobium sp. LC103]|uniref:sugar phosphate isomerase/epimerase family protein n=1 Tax=Aquamicrobium sp. LC103 TaxID=1120658 RepID=UPI00063EC1E5|nr:sugar phosphate isomerase/epimerase family protein [Aquamicrobium sp. LC103]TKT82505.1 sugar phosphate isomerase/epimerase [Aquamicrobium sp. LC103]